MPGSPKKKRSKRKVSDSDPKVPEGKAALAKRARAQSQSMIDDANDSQLPRRTEHRGAGTGGRGAQLEKIGDILHAPTRTSKSKGATSLDPDAPANPLAPEPPRKGCGSRPKKRQPPPLYSPSEEPRTMTSKSRSKKNKTPVVSAPTFELSNPPPTFALRETGGRYGFSPPIVPPSTEGRHSTHPGFLREALPPQPQAVTALPTDFEFQYSHDEGDQVVENTLAVGGDPNDVLKLHHERNGHPRLPDPALLELLRAAEVDPSNSKVKRKSKVVGGSKSNDEGPKATQLGWYSSHWKSFLEDAKVECRTQQALENPFPSLVQDLPVSITESLSASLVQWLKNGQHVDAGVWPAHKPDMARLLYDDLATWRSDLKKITISIAPSAYGLSPPDNIPIQEHAAWIQAATTELLKDGGFLRYGVDELGKTRNFAHPAFFQAIILFFYTGSYRIAHRRPAIFRKEVPLTCLALVCTVFNCVFQGLEKNGHGKSYSKFTSKEYESIYIWLLGLLNDVMKDPYHGPKLVRQLREWAKIGWAEASKLDGIDTSKHRHLRVQLD
ncbi:hypothetical protein DEU56DRAFT_759427 [Suillus clintonianus]|uniref:uncharacterized protein n=1 Tax=Suillus clintonianus TaxID=1904413 RepID=UPI001B88380C|nr:uncharacterized protein DEU56DRAFT_759427 [Suillus clintonianus]KAG2125089.1 hypothetical protein DEU56DRAFT_759427 [Suillus clintonianus]